MELVKATSGATCADCRERIRKGSWVTSLGGFWVHRACYKELAPAETSLASEEYNASVGLDEGPKNCGGCGEPKPHHDEWCNEGDTPFGGAEAPETCVSCGETEEQHGGTESSCYWSPERKEPVEEDGVPEEVQTSLPFAEPTPVDGKLPFAMPTAVEEETKPNVSGQPEPARDQWGRYLLPHPVTGLYSDGKDKANRRNGWMRATTFAKLAADTFSLTRYNERLTLLGATLRPDVVALAHGKHVKRDNKELNRLVTQVKETAGAKVAANIGTAVHGFTERVDAGLMTLDGVPEQYLPHVVSYLETLQEYGLEPVPGLIERTTLVDEWGKVVVGTFDRVLYHRASGTYLIGDLKTGETLEWGKMEIAVQLALYANGLNAWGVFDWNEGEWKDPSGPWGDVRVRTDYGVVMHLPIQGPNAGQCTLRRVNLAAGWDAAATSASVDTSRKRDDYMDADFTLPVAPYAPELPAAEPMDWVAMAGLVQSKEEASTLWLRAKAEGVAGVELNQIVEAAQQRLRELGVLG